MQTGKDRKCCRRLTAWYRGNPCAKWYLSTVHAEHTKVSSGTISHSHCGVNGPATLAGLLGRGIYTARPMQHSDPQAVRMDGRSPPSPSPAEKPRNLTSLAQYATSVAGSHALRSPLATSMVVENSPANPPHTSPVTGSQALLAIHTKLALFRG